MKTEFKYLCMDGKSVRFINAIIPECEGDKTVLIQDGFETYDNVHYYHCNSSIHDGFIAKWINKVVVPDVETEKATPAVTANDNKDKLKTIFENMGAEELRKKVREAGWRGASVLSASKKELVNFLLTGKSFDKPDETIPLDLPTAPAVITEASVPQSIPTKEMSINNTDIALQLAELISKLAPAKETVVEKQQIDIAEITAIFEKKISEEIDKIRQEMVKTVNIKIADRPKIDVGIQHKDFPDLLKIASQKDIPVLLTGPPGSGKTHLCGSIAKALSLPFYPLSVGQQTTKSDLVGFVKVDGSYSGSPLYSAYKNGGLFLLDEIDAGNSNVLITLNSLLSNGNYMFPNGELVSKHTDFIVFAGANTTGREGAIQFMGRNVLDAATLDRFVVWFLGYDEELEIALAGNKLWAKKVQEYRKNAAEFSTVLITPRASINGAKLLASGISQKKVETMVLWSGVSDSLIKKIKGA